MGMGIGLDWDMEWNLDSVELHWRFSAACNKAPYTQLEESACGLLCK